MTEGRLNKFFGEFTLLEQDHFIEEGNPKVGAFVAEQAKKLGVDVTVAAYERFENGIYRVSTEALVHEDGVVHRDDARLVLEGLAHDLGQAKEAHVADTVEELERLADARLDELVGDGDAALANSGHGGHAVAVLDVGGHVEGPDAAEGRDVHRVGRDRVEVGLERAVDGREALVPVVHGTGARLGDHEAAHVELGERVLVELLGVQHVARAGLDGVGDVHDDDVERAVVLLEEGVRVRVVHLEARVLEGAVVPLGHLLAAHVAHELVDVHHHDLLDRLVLEHLARRGELAAAADVDGLGVGVCQQGRVHERLVVDGLVVLGRLRLAVQHERLAERVRLDDLHGLELGLGLERHGLERGRQVQVLGQRLLVPERLLHRGQLGLLGGDRLLLLLLRLGHASCYYRGANARMARNDLSSS
ncbi:hypothetical protein ON010_g4509 [Phytophthora cinnamomi]|nr:hypothetical protein ON010_g4509 [Phytophthora cinnamomi]